MSALSLAAGPLLALALSQTSGWVPRRGGSVDPLPARATFLSVDAGEINAESINVGTLDAGEVRATVVYNPDGGTLHVPNGVNVDTGSSFCLNGPPCTQRLRSTGPNVVVEPGGGRLVSTDGFTANTDVQAGNTSANGANLSGGAAGATLRVAGGAAPVSDAGFIIRGGLPNGPVIVDNPTGVWAPRIQTVDGGTLGLGGYGWQMEPVPYIVPCDSSRRGTVIRWLGAFGYEQWECTEGSLIACDGCWTAPHNEVLPFAAYTPADIGGVSNSSGVIFTSVDPGTHPTAIGGFRLQVVETGTGPGQIVKGRVFQRNAADGGQRDLLTFALPCETPVGTCVYYSDVYVSQPASSGCAYEATRLAVSQNFLEGGAIDFEFQPDGGQCSANPRAWGSGYVKRVMYPDGGGG